MYCVQFRVYINSYTLSYIFWYNISRSYFVIRLWSPIYILEPPIAFYSHNWIQFSSLISVSWILNPNEEEEARIITDLIIHEIKSFRIFNTLDPGRCLLLIDFYSFERASKCSRLREKKKGNYWAKSTPKKKTPTSVKLML